jgi:outer membrane protein
VRLALVGALALLLAPAAARADEAPRTLTLREAARLAIANQPTARAALERARGAGAQADVARAGYLPSVSLSGLGGGTFVDQPVVPDPPIRVQATNLVVQGSLSATMPLWDFGRTSNAVRAADQGVASAEADARAAASRVALDASSRYLAVLADAEALEAARVTIEQRKQHALIAAELADHGVRPTLDKTRAQLEVDVAELDRASLDAKMRQDTITLAASLGLDPARPVAVQPVDEASLATDEDPSRAAATAEAQRPELAAARARVSLAGAQINAASAQNNPSLAVVASGTAMNTTIVSGQGLPGPTELAQGGLSLSWPILDLSVSAKKRAAEAAQAAAVEDLRAQSLSIRAEAAQAAVAARAARGVLAQAQRVLDGATMALSQATERYQRGVAPFIEELIDAQARERSARGSLLNARLSLALARVRLLAAVAGPSFVDRLR